MSVSRYTRTFDHTNPNWTGDPLTHHHFLNSVEQHLNNVLTSRRHVFLNEAYDALGFSRTTTGVITGWLYRPGARISLKSHTNLLGEIVIDFNVDGVMFQDIESDTRPTTPESEEHVILVAFQVVGKTEEEAQKCLAESLPQPSQVENLECWWVAEDNRRDGSDCDSAIFVPRGSQEDMRALVNQHFENHAEEWSESGYPYEGTDVSGYWFQEKHSV